MKYKKMINIRTYMAYLSRSIDMWEKHVNNIAFNIMDIRPIMEHV